VPVRVPVWPAVVIEVARRVRDIIEERQRRAVDVAIAKADQEAIERERARRAVIDDERERERAADRQVVFGQPVPDLPEPVILPAPIPGIEPPPIAFPQPRPAPRPSGLPDPVSTPQNRPISLPKPARQPIPAPQPTFRFLPVPFPRPSGRPDPRLRFAPVPEPLPSPVAPVGPKPISPLTPIQPGKIELPGPSANPCACPQRATRRKNSKQYRRRKTGILWLIED
jgi:hypothetical protein